MKTVFFLSLIFLMSNVSFAQFPSQAQSGIEAKDPLFPFGEVSTIEGGATSLRNSNPEISMTDVLVKNTGSTLVSIQSPKALSDGSWKSAFTVVRGRENPTRIAPGETAVFTFAINVVNNKVSRFDFFVEGEGKPITLEVSGRQPLGRRPMPAFEYDRFAAELLTRVGKNCPKELARALAGERYIESASDDVFTPEATKANSIVVKLGKGGKPAGTLTVKLSPFSTAPTVPYVHQCILNLN